MGLYKSCPLLEWNAIDKVYDHSLILHMMFFTETVQVNYVHRISIVIVLWDAKTIDNRQSYLPQIILETQKKGHLESLQTISSQNDISSDYMLSYAQSEINWSV